MTAKADNDKGKGNSQDKDKKQIPFGDDNQKNNQKNNGNNKDNGEIQGSLHCAADGETVRCFGRDDGSLRGSVRAGGWLRIR
jgi:hypothetical protein